MDDWTCVPVDLTEGRQRLHSASSSYLMVPRTRGLSQSAGIRCVRAFDVEQTTYTSVIDGHDITNVSN